MTASSFNTNKQNLWPASRGIDVYNEMTGFNIVEALNKLPEHRRGIIDVGAGRGKALEELSKQVSGLNAFAVGPNIPEVRQRNITVVGAWAPSFDLPIHRPVPVVVDVFGGFSYAMEAGAPAAHKVFIREGSWLAPGGTARACSEPGRLGDDFALERIQRFFSKAMGLKFTWQDYQKFAEGNQVWETQRRFILENPNTYETLVKEAEMYVGKALRGRIIWESPDNQAKIFEVHHHDEQYFKENRDELDKPALRFQPAVAPDSYPQWPNARPLETYNKMVGFDIETFLQDGGVYFDSGSGSFQVPAELVKRNPRIIASGISLSPPETLPQGITAIIDTLPEYDFRNFRECNLITDVFGAFTFGDKKTEEGYVPAPMEILIRLCLQLAPGGRLVICTEKDRLGDEFERKRIEKFLKKKLGLECKFEFYRHKAEARGIEETQLRLTVDNNKTYSRLIEKFEEIVGVAANGEVLWESKEEDPAARMQIRATVYKKKKN